VDSELTSLTRTAGSTLVTLMASDAWRAARDLVLRWWRRAQPGRAETIAAELDASYEDATGGAAAGADPAASGSGSAGEDPAVRDPGGPGPLAGDPADTGDTGDEGDAGDADTAAELRAQWQGLFRRALAACPEAADDLRRLLAELDTLAAAAPASPPAGRHITVTQRATASGSARVLQAGRDQHVSER
jgi:hypothetical protein